MTEVNPRIKAYSCDVVLTVHRFILPARGMFPSLLRGRRGGCSALSSRGVRRRSELDNCAWIHWRWRRRVGLSHRPHLLGGRASDVIRQRNIAVAVRGRTLKVSFLLAVLALTRQDSFLYIFFSGRAEFCLYIYAQCVMTALSPFAFNGKYFSDTSDGEGDFSGEENPRKGSGSFCDKSPENECDSSANESDDESLTDVAVLQIQKPHTNSDPIVSGAPRCTVQDPALPNVFHKRFSNEFYFTTTE